MLGSGDKDQIKQDLLPLYWIISTAFGGLQ